MGAGSRIGVYRKQLCADFEMRKISSQGKKVREREPCDPPIDSPKSVVSGSRRTGRKDVRKDTVKKVGKAGSENPILPQVASPPAAVDHKSIAKKNTSRINHKEKPTKETSTVSSPLPQRQ